MLVGEVLLFFFLFFIFYFAKMTVLNFLKNRGGRPFLFFIFALFYFCCCRSCACSKWPRFADLTRVSSIGAHPQRQCWSTNWSHSLSNRTRPRSNAFVIYAKVRAGAHYYFSWKIRNNKFEAVDFNTGGRGRETFN